MERKNQNITTFFKVVAAAANFTIRPEDADGGPFILSYVASFDLKLSCGTFAVRILSFCAELLQCSSVKALILLTFAEFLALSDPSALPDL